MIPVTYTDSSTFWFHLLADFRAYFILSYLVLLVLHLLRWKREELPIVFVALNFTLAVYGLYGLSYFAYETYLTWQSGYLARQHSFYNRTLGRYLFLVTFFEILPSLLYQLFWLRFFRRSVALAVIFSLYLILELFNFSLASIFQYLFINFYWQGDFLPSSWSYGMPSLTWLLRETFIHLILFSICWFGGYYFLRRRKKRIQNSNILDDFN